MRVRMIRPSYWTDADLQTRLSCEVREFYIGLWMQADDEGYIDWDIVRIGAELYPFRPLSWRTRNLAAWASLLSPHVEVLDCGRHAVIPSLPRHQTPPRPSSVNRRAHDKCRFQVTAHARSDMQLHASAGREVEGREGKEKEGAAAPVSERTGDLKSRLGDFTAIVGGKAS